MMREKHIGTPKHSPSHTGLTPQNQHIGIQIRVGFWQTRATKFQLQTEEKTGERRNIYQLINSYICTRALYQPGETQYLPEFLVKATITECMKSSFQSHEASGASFIVNNSTPLEILVQRNTLINDPPNKVRDLRHNFHLLDLFPKRVQGCHTMCLHTFNQVSVFRGYPIDVFDSVVTV